MIPDEFDYREVLHQEDDEFPDDWMHRSYPVGHARVDVNWPKPDVEEVERFRDELAARDRARRELGRFGFSGQLPPAA